MKNVKEGLQDAGVSSGLSRRRALYVCVKPGERALILNYLNGSNRADREAVIDHLRLCLSCRESAATMLRLGQTMRDRRENNAGAASDEVEDDHVRSNEVRTADHQLPVKTGGQ